MLGGASVHSVFAGPQFFEFFAGASDLESLGGDGETEFLTDFILELRNLLAFELDNFFAVLADDMAVVGVLGVVWIVELVILAEVHFPHQSTFGEQGKGAIDGGSGNGLVAFPGPFQQLFRSEMFVCAEDRVHDGLPLGGGAQPLSSQKLHEFLLCGLFVQRRHIQEYISAREQVNGSVDWIREESPEFFDWHSVQ